MTKGREARMDPEKMVGKRTPLPGGDKQLSPQMRASAARGAREERTVAEEDRPGIPREFTVNPARANRVREEKTGYAAGGAVRGGGCATKGVGKGTMR
jgi:hypothetical protein